MAAVTPAANTANARVGRGDLDALAAATSPLTLAAEQLLPVDAAASALLPGGVLRRGMAVTIGGRARRSLALTLAAEASSAGSWVALVGVRDMGLAAVEEYGLSLTRLAVIEDPGPDWGAVVAALIGSVDVIITSTPERVSSRDGRRLAARLRERGSVVIELRSQRETVLQGDVTLHADSASWQGLHRVTGVWSGARSWCTPAGVVPQPEVGVSRCGCRQRPVGPRSSQPPAGLAPTARSSPTTPWPTSPI